MATEWMEVPTSNNEVFHDMINDIHIASDVMKSRGEINSIFLKKLVITQRSS